MAKSDQTEITIGGKIYTLSGNESVEYMQQVAAFINSKIDEFQNSSAYWTLPMETRSIMLELNLADEYLKAKDELAALQTQMEEAQRLLRNSQRVLAQGQAVSEEEQKRLRSELDEMVESYESRLTSSVAFYESKLAVSREEVERMREESEASIAELRRQLSQALDERDAARAHAEAIRRRVKSAAEEIAKM